MTSDSGGDSPLGTEHLRKVARAVLARRAGASTTAEGLAVAAETAYADLGRVSTPLIGQAGVDALAGRALHLAQREYPWLVHAHQPVQPEAFAQIVFCLQRQEAEVAMDAAVAVFAIFTGLLVTFIGEPLTAFLLRKAWPEAFSGRDTVE